MFNEIKEFSSKYDDKEVQELNLEIKELNVLIKKYNKTIKSSVQREQIMDIYQKQQRIINLISFAKIAFLDDADLFFTKLYADFDASIKNEITKLGIASCSEDSFNIADICLNQSIEDIPSEQSFLILTTPSLLSRAIGNTNSLPIKQAARLLSEITSASIKDNTKENYWRLTTLKRSIRDILGSSVLSKGDEAALRFLIQTINGRIRSIIEHNADVKSIVFQKTCNFAENISKADNEVIEPLICYLNNQVQFNQADFHNEFDKKLPGLENYTIQYLGGNNAKNYLLKCPFTQEVFVLKISADLGNPRSTAERLKYTKVRNGLTSVFSSRQLIIETANKGIELTEFCAKGDLLSYGNSIKTLEDKLLSATYFYTQQTEILSDFVQNNAIFTDMKPTNFLVTAEDKLVIADTKSFVNAPKGIFDTETNLQYPRTPGFSPPELETSFKTSADKYHAYLMGVSLYVYLTGEDTSNVIYGYHLKKLAFVPQNPEDYSTNPCVFDDGGILKVAVKTSKGDIITSLLKDPPLPANALNNIRTSLQNTNLSFDKDLQESIMNLLYSAGYNPTVRDNPSKDFFTYDNEIFQSKKGEKFKTLIQGLTNEDPVARFSLSRAKETLDEIQKDVKSERSSFKSKTEAFLYAINYLIELKSKYNLKIDSSIQYLQILFENHSQSPKNISTLLDKLRDEFKQVLPKSEVETMRAISNAIITSTYEQTLQEKYENPLARRFESQMQITLLQNPTDLMMKAVGLVSKALLHVLDEMSKKEDYVERLNFFCTELTGSLDSSTGFGSSPNDMSFEKVKEILVTNKPEDLQKIMFIHFKFTEKHMRRLQLGDDITAPNKNMPTGRLKEIIETFEDGKYKDNPQSFFDKMDEVMLQLIGNTEIYESDLYHVENGRGREGRLEKIQSSQMGLMLTTQKEYEDGLPTDPSKWTPDAKYQRANLDSIYVRDLIENDSIYVAGPSGMTSLFLNIMEIYGNFASIEEKQHYLSAISAYMIAGGFHSLHEVIGPAEYALDLVPGYNVSPPQSGKIAKPPNLHQFYQQQMMIDPQFEARYVNGWRQFIADYKTKQNLHVHRPIEKEKSNIVNKIIENPSKQVSTAITSEVAASQLVNLMNKAVTRYSNYIHSKSPITLEVGVFSGHDIKSLERAIKLLELARKEGSLGRVAQLLSEYVNTKEPKLSKYSFISFLLNELKAVPELVLFINEHNQSKDRLQLNPQLDYTVEAAATGRTSAFNSFKTIKVESPEGHQQISSNQIDLKKQLKDLQEPIKKDRKYNM